MFLNYQQYIDKLNICWYTDIREFGGEIMAVSYNRLWKKLIDLNMNKTQLREKTGMTTNALAKLGRNENVSTEILCRICEVLDCKIEDIIEIVSVN